LSDLRARLRSGTITASLCLLLMLSALPAGSADEKQLSIYSAATNYSIPVLDRNGREYVGLVDLLDPLGSVSAKVEGTRWKVRFNNVDAEFTQGRDRARVRGRDAALFGPFVLEGDRGLVPIVSLSSLLPRFVGTPLTYSEASRRLFIGSVATHFTAEINQTNPPRLVLNFSAPVNPTIATEPGHLRMVFRREPVVSPASPKLRFDDPTIPLATYSETNGIAEIDVNGTVPLMASFSNEGRTITVAPVPQVQPAPSASQAPPLPSTLPAAPPVLPGAPVPAPIPRHFFAIIDASHGGDDRGVALSPTLAEKDVTLGLARQLRQELQTRGVSALVLRDSDATISADQRAIFTNTAHPVIYLALHAASDGHGVRLYTAMLPAGSENNGPFVSWDLAQASFLASSQAARDGLAAELQRRQIPVRSLSAPLRPLNNLTTTAIAIEVAPPGTNVAELASPAYQQSLASALANGVLSIRGKLEAPQ
jgi:N-acetylmuramoyl-L-alanine amidase